MGPQQVPVRIPRLIPTECVEIMMTSGLKSAPAILHVCRREMLRPLRDEILRISGFNVDSTLDSSSALSMFSHRAYDLVLVDVDGEKGIAEAEHICSAVKTAQRAQKVAFVCNWRVADLTDCPDEILRTEFDPGAFVKGVRRVVSLQ